MILEHINCDLCGSSDYIVRYRKPDNWLWLNYFEYPVVECKSCGLVYVNPRPTFEEMARFYPAGYHDARDDQVHLERYEHQFDYIAKINAASILDIGCARGDWLNYVHKKIPGIELHGVDAFSDGVMSESIIFHQNTLCDAILHDSYFDLITSWAVFEHVHTPSTYFEVVSRILHPGGVFVFLVTNAESIYGKYAYKEDIPRHLYHFSEKSIVAYGKKHGLIVEDISYDTRFWDGTGRGAIRQMIARQLGLSWRDRHLVNIPLLPRAFLRIGAILDKLVFALEWEAKFKRSGIIVVTMSKGS